MLNAHFINHINAISLYFQVFKSQDELRHIVKMSP